MIFQLSQYLQNPNLTMHSCTHDTQLDKKPASRKQKPRLFFTPEEDSALQQGIQKYGFGNWQKMLNDKGLHVLKGRTQDAMNERADI